MTKCLSETNGFIFLNPGHSMGSLCGSGPQGFRQLTKHILLLLCCPPTMLFTYRRTSGSVQQMNEMAWLSFTEPLHRKSWLEPLTVIMSKMVIYEWYKLFEVSDFKIPHCLKKYRHLSTSVLFHFLWSATLTIKNDEELESTTEYTLKARKSKNYELTDMKLFLSWKLFYHIFYHALHIVRNLVRQLFPLI